MKYVLKAILKNYLKALAKFKLFLRRPTIIAVAGSANKGFVKNEVERVLRENGFSVRSSEKNFNTDIGLPLSVLNLPSGYGWYGKWPPVMAKALFSVFKKDDARYLVLELGASDPGDMKHLLSIIKPEITVITTITQRYLESFSDMDHLVEEYKIPVARTDKKGLLVLNNDNPRTRELKEHSKAKVCLVGFKEDSNFGVLKVERSMKGERVQIRYGDVVEEININRFGEHHIYATLAALALLNHLKNNAC